MKDPKIIELPKTWLVDLIELANKANTYPEYDQINVATLIGYIKGAKHLVEKK